MVIWPAGVPANKTFTLDQPGLFMGATLWNNSTGTPVQITDVEGMINDVLPLLNWAGNSYVMTFLGLTGVPYLLQLASYTDDTYTEVSNAEPQGDESFTFVEFTDNSSIVGVFGELVGTVENYLEI